MITINPAASVPLIQAILGTSSPFDLGLHIVGSADGESLEGEYRYDYILGGDGDDTIYGHEGNDMLIGGPGHDHVFGGPGDDKLVADLGNDLMSGGDGVDFGIFTSGLRSDFTVTSSLVIDNRIDATVNLGRDTLQGVERLLFLDYAVAFDLQDNGAASLAAKVVGALAKDQINNPLVMGLMIDAFEKLMSTPSISSPEVGIEHMVSVLSNHGIMLALTQSEQPQALVNLLFQNIAGRQALASEMDSVLALQAQWGHDTWQNKIVAVAAMLPENAANIDLMGLADGGLAYIATGMLPFHL